MDTPPGHGHTDTLEFVDGWAAVRQPAGWTDQQADQQADQLTAIVGQLQ